MCVGRDILEYGGNVETVREMGNGGDIWGRINTNEDEDARMVHKEFSLI